MVKVREGNEETVHYFITNEELETFKAANANLFNGDTEMRKKDGPTRRANSCRPAPRKQGDGGVAGQTFPERAAGGPLCRAGQAPV